MNEYSDAKTNAEASILIMKEMAKWQAESRFKELAPELVKELRKAGVLFPDDNNYAALKKSHAELILSTKDSVLMIDEILKAINPESGINKQSPRIARLFKAISAAESLEVKP